MSPLVEVDSINSIQHRLYCLLQYLIKQYPGEGWDQFLVHQNIQWSRLIVAGHSQGAGHAAYLAKKFPVKRVLIFAGPQDYLAKFSKPAGWQFRKSATAANRFYAFLHVDDPFDSRKQLADCRALMTAALADTAMVMPDQTPVTRKHILFTDIKTNNPHGSMMQPVFVKTWQYLLAANP